MDDNMKAELCVNALDMAINRYIRPAINKGDKHDLIAHSDRGSQYTSKKYRNQLGKHGITQSMGKTGSCYDNARMESFFATMKKELIYSLDYKNMTKAELRAVIFSWVELDYNRERFYSANEDYLPPPEKRKQYYSTINYEKQQLIIAA